MHICRHPSARHPTGTALTTKKKSKTNHNAHRRRRYSTKGGKLRSVRIRPVYRLLKHPPALRCREEGGPGGVLRLRGPKGMPSPWKRSPAAWCPAGDQTVTQWRVHASVVGGGGGGQRH